MAGGAHPSPFAALSFPNSKKVPIYCWVDREFSGCCMAKPSLELTLYGNFLHHNQVALTTRLGRLSHITVINLKMELFVYNAVTCPKDLAGMANSVDPDQTAPRSSLIWVCTVCSDVSVLILRTVTVVHVPNNFSLL